MCRDKKLFKFNGRQRLGCGHNIAANLSINAAKEIGLINYK